MGDLLIAAQFVIVILAITVGPLVFFLKLIAKGRSGLVKWPEQVCDACDGTGRLVDANSGSHQCLRCSGTGRIAR